MAQVIKKGELCSPFFMRGSVAAAAKNDQRNDDDPAAVVITKQVANAVVIHKKSSFKALGSHFLSLAIIV